MALRHTHQGRLNNPVNRIIDNLNKKKFTTNIDDEAEALRQKNEEISRKRKNISNVEPFWQDFNSTITDICKQREDHPSNPNVNKVNKRQRGPS